MHQIHELSSASSGMAGVAARQTAYSKPDIPNEKKTSRAGHRIAHLGEGLHSMLPLTRSCKGTHQVAEPRTAVAAAVSPLPLGLSATVLRSYAAELATRHRSARGLANSSVSAPGARCKAGGGQGGRSLCCARGSGPTHLRLRGHSRATSQQSRTQF